MELLKKRNEHGMSLEYILKRLQDPDFIDDLADIEVRSNKQAMGRVVKKLNEIEGNLEQFKEEIKDLRKLTRNPQDARSKNLGIQTRSKDE